MGRQIQILALGSGILLAAGTSVAEYRAYLLKIENPTSQSSRTVTSTLDPQQYSGYYSVESQEIVTLQNSWMCRGRTDDFLETCPAPQRKPSSEEPTSPSEGETPGIPPQ